MDGPGAWSFTCHLCAADRDHWSARAQFNLTMLVLVIGLGGGLLFLSWIMEWTVLTTPIVAVGLVFVGIVWLVLDARIDVIQPIEISEKAISLEGVAEEFVAALEKHRSSVQPLEVEPLPDDAIRPGGEEGA
jgi:hypothetical protein